MPPEATTDRLRRILVLVPWVMAHAGSTVDDVCARFGVTRAELAADVELLMVCGLPPFGPGDLIWADMDDGTVNITMAEYLASPPRLTQQEAVALLIMGRAVASMPGTEEAEVLRGALGKLAGAIAPGQADVAEALAHRVAVDLVTAGVGFLGQIRSAIAARERVRIVYFSHGRGETTERVIEPLLLQGSGRAWYVRAMDGERGEERLYRLDRIKDLHHTGETFEPPPGFDAQAAARGPLFTPSADDREVVLDLGPGSAWMKDAMVADGVTEMPDGRTRVRLRTAHFSWLIALLLSAGPSAHAVSPPELVEAVRTEARAALARYGS